MRKKTIVKHLYSDTLGNICSMQAGGTPSRANPKYWENGKIKWLSAKHIADDKINSWEYISTEGLANSSAKLSNPGDIILDNACGSGSFLVAAAIENRNYIGIEKNQNVALHKVGKTDYIEVSNKRIKEVLNQKLQYSLFSEEDLISST